MAEATKPTGVTFTISDTTPSDVKYQQMTVKELVDQRLGKKLNGTVLKTTNPEHPVRCFLPNGMVNAALSAYSSHHHLILSPDSVWVTITTAFANFVDRNAEQMRNMFVAHDGMKELVVYGGGSIQSANYDHLIHLISEKIEENTKYDIRNWLECNFSTTDVKSRTISKIVLMGAMKNYFSYKMCLCCGLPGVTLEGTLEDWQEIRNRVTRLATYQIPDLSSWSEVLGYVLDQFVASYQGKVDKDFWNRIAHKTGGGSGPRYLEGWILAFVPWTDGGSYILNSLETIKSTNSYGKMDTNDIPVSAVEVPVKIDDNGTEYDTVFYAGALLPSYDASKNTMKASLDWALIDVSKRG